MLTLPGNVNVKPIVDRAIGELRMALGSGPYEVAPSTIDFRFEEVDLGESDAPLEGDSMFPSESGDVHGAQYAPLRGGPDTDDLRQQVLEAYRRPGFNDDFSVLLNRFEQSARTDEYRFWRHKSGLDKRTAPIPEGHVVGDGGDCGCYPISRSSDWHLCVDPESPTYVFGVWGMRPSKARNDQEEQS
jgi:hypothetical protein